MKPSIYRVVIFNGRYTVRETSSFDIRKEDEKIYLEKMFNYLKDLASHHGWGAKLVGLPNIEKSEISNWVEMMKRHSNPDFELGKFDPRKVY